MSKRDGRRDGEGCPGGGGEGGGGRGVEAKGGRNVKGLRGGGGGGGGEWSDRGVCEGERRDNNETREWKSDEGVEGEKEEG